MSRDLQVRLLDAERAANDAFCFVEYTGESGRLEWVHVEQVRPAGFLPDPKDWRILCADLLDRGLSSVVCGMRKRFLELLREAGVSYYQSGHCYGATAAARSEAAGDTARLSALTKRVRAAVRRFQRWTIHEWLDNLAAHVVDGSSGGAVSSAGLLGGCGDWDREGPAVDECEATDDADPYVGDCSAFDAIARRREWLQGCWEPLPFFSHADIPALRAVSKSHAMSIYASTLMDTQSLVDGLCDALV